MNSFDKIIKAEECLEKILNGDYNEKINRIKDV